LCVCVCGALDCFKAAFRRSIRKLPGVILWEVVHVGSKIVAYSAEASTDLITILNVGWQYP
jgi:hypothetical protein